jgi:hypothetical protein
MSKRLPLVIAGIIFAIVALVHLLRLIYHWNIMIGGQIIPMSVSTGALIVSIVLAVWMFLAACC